MKREFQPRRFREILANENAQAMTEFVIIIPIILLTFFAALQTILIAQAAQLTSYAAFAAARSYATSYSRFVIGLGNEADGREAAKNRAHLAASLVMAPVSHGVPGELSQGFLNIREQTQNSTSTDQRNQSFAEGFAIAFVYRIKNFTISAFDPNPASDRSVFSASFDYDMPISIPGLAEMWNYVNERNPASSSGQPFEDELDDYTATTGNLPVGEFLTALDDLYIGFFGYGSPDADFDTIVNTYRNFVVTTAGSGAAGADVAIRIRGQSMMGLEPWEGVTGGGGSALAAGDPNTAHCITDIENLQQAFDDQEVITDEACDEAVTASNEWVSALQDLNACEADPDNDFGDCADERSTESSKKNTFDSELAECEDEGDILEDKNEDLQNYVCVPL